MKHRKNKLDPFATRLEQWETEGKTLAEMLTLLKAEGCASSTGSLSTFLQSLRSARLEANLFGLVASGGRMNAELDRAFKENPAPEIARLNQVVKTLVMSLQVQGTANPELLELSNSLYKTVLEFAKLEDSRRDRERQEKLDAARLAAKTRDQDLDERRVLLLEQKAAQAEATEKVLTNADLSPEQRAQRIKEIYGRA